MQQVVIDRYGGPEVLKVVEEDAPRPGPGEVRVRVLAAGVSFTDALIRAGTYLGGPKPPFTPGYELVGVVEELGLGCSRLREGDRVGALTVWGADAETRLRAGEVRGRGARGPRPGGGREPHLPLHDRLPDAAPHGEGAAAARRCSCTARPAGSAPRPSSWERWPGCRLFGTCFGARHAARSSGSARWRSTTATRTSSRGCGS